MAAPKGCAWLEACESRVEDFKTILTVYVVFEIFVYFFTVSAISTTVLNTYDS